MIKGSALSESINGDSLFCEDEFWYEADEILGLDSDVHEETDAENGRREQESQKRQQKAKSKAYKKDRVKGRKNGKEKYERNTFYPNDLGNWKEARREW
ncbi:unnamed protein product [Blepharisma stoltei]|uniref:Uncharacterized protein n=1 Tax=Blepharisma stoltei TaxID=1481888 RepID=A0AAU9IGR5_9CILI|nr:unnamed protein product [Blepharisma stoltei]